MLLIDSLSNILCFLNPGTKSSKAKAEPKKQKEDGRDLDPTKHYYQLYSYKGPQFTITVPQFDPLSSAFSAHFFFLLSLSIMPATLLTLCFIIPCQSL